MIKKIAFTLIIVLSCYGSDSLAACDFAAASNAIIAAKKMATFEDESDRLTVRWSSDWSHFNKDQKFALINTVANADACLMGKARPIFFYYYDKLVGKADPAWGIKQLE